MRVTLLVNPYASSVTPKKQRLVEATLGASHELTVVCTACRDHATTLAAEAAAGGAEIVVVLGGDGTLNEAANGLVGTDTAMAPLPGGSTNVFARTIGAPNKLGKAIVQLDASLAAGSIRRMPLGVVNGRRFLFHAGLGFDAAVVAQVERRPALKHKLGQTAFVFATLTTLARHFDLGRPYFTLHVGDTTVPGAYSIVMNSNPYTYMGRIPLNLTPDATPGRGLVAVTVRTMHLPAVVGLLTSAIGSGERLRTNKQVDHRPDLLSFTVTGIEGPFPYQVDGDFLGLTEELDFAYEPHALAIVAPPATSPPPSGGDG
jgi:diacylglycerol kinase family enzyme